MFKKIVVAYDESPEAKRALTAAIDLANQLRAELRLITVREPLPAYAAYVEAAFPGSERIFGDERHTFYEDLQKEAKAQALAHGLSLRASLSKAMRSKVSRRTLNAGRPIFSSWDAVTTPLPPPKFGGHYSRSRRKDPLQHPGCHVVHGED